MSRNVILLSEVAAHLEMLEVRCGRCDRRGRLRLDRLVAQHGPMRQSGRCCVPRLAIAHTATATQTAIGAIPTHPSWRRCLPISLPMCPTDSSWQRSAWELRFTIDNLSSR